MTLMKGAQTDLGNEMKCNLIDLTQFCRNRNTSNDVQLSFVRKVIYLASSPYSLRETIAWFNTIGGANPAVRIWPYFIKLTLSLAHFQSALTMKLHGLETSRQS